VDAAEAVCAGDGIATGEVLPLLEELVAKSLVGVTLVGPEARYGLLATVRQYAWEKLETSGGVERARDRHLTHFMDVAAQASQPLKGPIAGAWLDRLTVEHENLQWALRWCMESGNAQQGLALARDLWRYWDTRGHWAQGRGAFEGLLAIYAGPPSTVWRARGLLCCSHLARRQGDYEASRGYGERSLAIYRELDIPRGVTGALLGLGTVAKFLGDRVAARARFEESLEISRRSGDRRAAANSVNNIGLLAQDRGDYEAARTFLEEGLAIRRKMGDVRDVAGSLGNLGFVAHDQGDLEGARGYIEESLEICRDLGDTIGIAGALCNLGMVFLSQGEDEAARTSFEESLTHFREGGHTRGVAQLLYNLGNVAHSQGDYDVAFRYTSESLVLRWQLGAKNDLPPSFESLAFDAMARAEPDRATRLAGAAAKLREDLSLPLIQAEQDGLQRSLESARQDLGPTAYDAALAEGRTLTLDEAVAYALGEVTWDELADEVAERVAAGESEAGEEAQKAEEEGSPE